MSLVLVLVMALSINGFTPKVADAEDMFEYTVGVEIATPYQLIVSDAVSLSKDDLTDDFGIGLSKDGKEDYTAARAFAKALRRYVFLKEIYKDGDDFTETDVKKANELMPKYLKSSMSEYGLFIEGIAADGKTMNAGTAKDGKVDPDGAWTVLMNDKPSDVGISSIVLSKDDSNDVSVFWASGASDFANGWPSLGRFEGASYVFADGRMYDGKCKEADGVKLVKDSYVYDAATGKSVAKSSPVSGGSVDLYYEDESEPLRSTYSKDDGSLELEGLNLRNGVYRVVATEDVQSADGTYTYSKIAYTEGALVYVGKPGIPQKVKTKVSGKKAKKNVKVSWKHPADHASYTDFYQVYISKKKSGGFKKIGKEPYDNKTTLKLKKGTYFIKVRCIRSMDCGDADGLETFYINGDFSAPVKVKVK